VVAGGGGRDVEVLGGRHGGLQYGA
jgi:hypothetical protein